MMFAHALIALYAGLAGPVVEREPPVRSERPSQALEPVAGAAVMSPLDKALAAANFDPTHLPAALVACRSADPMGGALAARLRRAWPTWRFKALPVAEGTGNSLEELLEAADGRPDGTATCWLVAMLNDGTTSIVPLRGEGSAVDALVTAAAWVPAAGSADADSVVAPPAATPPPRVVDMSLAVRSMGSRSSTTLGAVLASDGRPTVVNFWADWCGPCVKELPELEALSRRLAPGTRLIGVAHARPQNEVPADMVVKAGLTYDQFTFLDTQLFREIFGSGLQLPAFALFVDSNLVVSAIGTVKTEAVRSLIARAEAEAATPSERSSP